MIKEAQVQAQNDNYEGALKVLSKAMHNKAHEQKDLIEKVKILLFLIHFRLIYKRKKRKLKMKKSVKKKKKELKM